MDSSTRDISRSHRPRRTAATRRQQRLRAEHRTICRFLQSADAMMHRGCQDTKLGLALATALRQQQDSHTQPPAPLCRHHLRGRCIYGSACRFSHDGQTETSDDHLKPCDDQVSVQCDNHMVQCDDQHLEQSGDHTVEQDDDHKMAQCDDHKMAQCDDHHLQKCDDHTMVQCDDHNMAQCDVAQSEQQCDAHAQQQGYVETEPNNTRHDGYVKSQLLKIEFVQRFLCERATNNLQKFQQCAMDFMALHDQQSGRRLPESAPPSAALQPQLEEEQPMPPEYANIVAVASNDSSAEHVPCKFLQRSRDRQRAIRTKRSPSSGYEPG